MNDDHDQQQNNKKEDEIISSFSKSILDSYLFVDDGPINSICKSLTGFILRKRKREKEREREREREVKREEDKIDYLFVG